MRRIRHTPRQYYDPGTAPKPEALTSSGGTARVAVMTRQQRRALERQAAKRQDAQARADRQQQRAQLADAEQRRELAEQRAEHERRMDAHHRAMYTWRMGGKQGPPPPHPVRPHTPGYGS
jgi:hypothetical protein